MPNSTEPTNLAVAKGGVLGENASRYGMVVAAFPATGKSTLAAQRPGAVVDSDSSLFSWAREARGRQRVRHPNWPANYMVHIRERLALGHLVLVSTHAEVRQALLTARIPFVLAYPTPQQRQEYRARMLGRHSSTALIAQVTHEWWDDALAECAEQRGCVHVRLGAGQFLADVLR